MVKAPVTSNTLKLLLIAVALFLMAAALLLLFAANLFSAYYFRLDAGFLRAWSLVTFALVGVGSATMGVFIIRAWNREAEAIVLINWLRDMDDLTSLMRYPIGSDCLRQIGDMFEQLFANNRGWIAMAKVPGLLISGEVFRRKFLTFAHVPDGTDWSPAWGGNLLDERMEGDASRDGGIFYFPEEVAGGQYACWIVRSKDGDLAVGVFIALDAGKTYSNYPLFDNIIQTALALFVKRLSVLLVDVVDRREKLGNEGLGLTFRILVHEMSNEMQGAYNNLDAWRRGETDLLDDPVEHIQANLARGKYWAQVMRDAPVLLDAWVPKEIQAEGVSLDEYLGQIFDEARTAWREVVFVIRGSTRGIQVLADGNLSSLLRNVIFNAASFTPEGGLVTISVTPSGFPPEPSVSIRVLDQGKGVSEDIAMILFDSNVPSERRPRGFRGMGVGLMVARQIARSFGGDLTVYPIPEGGFGGDFEIILPLVYGV